MLTVVKKKNGRLAKVRQAVAYKLASLRHPCRRGSPRTAQKAWYSMLSPALTTSLRNFSGAFELKTWSSFAAEAKQKFSSVVADSAGAFLRPSCKIILFIESTLLDIYKENKFHTG